MSRRSVDAGYSRVCRECGAPAKSRGLCANHAVPCRDCGRQIGPGGAKGYCNTCYARAKKRQPMCRALKCRKKPQKSGYCIEHNAEWKGNGIIACDGCGAPLRDHSLTVPCPSSALTPTGTARQTAP